MLLIEALFGDRNVTVKRLISPGALLLLLPCILLWKIFAGFCLLPAQLLNDVYPWRTGNPKDLVPWNVLQFDGITQFYPWRLFAAQTWKSGFIPLWNPHELCGSPFLANGQSAVLYPPNLLFVLLPVKFAFGWSDLLHLIFTGVCCYLFLRRAIGRSQWSSAVGAACWQLSTWQISWIALPSFLDTAAWLPLSMLAVYYLSKRPSFRRAFSLGVLVALMVLAGHLQISFYCLLLICSYAVFAIVTNKTLLSAALQATAATAIIVVLLTAAQVLPTLELSHLSTRGVTIATATGYASYVRLALSPEQLCGLFVPGFFGHPDRGTYWQPLPYPECAAYVGVIGLLLSVVALVRRPSKQTIFFLVIAVVALLIAVGTPINMLLYYGMPGFSSTGSPARIIVILTFCLSVLSAFGMDELVDKPVTAWPGAAMYVLSAVAMLTLSLVDLIRRDSSYLTFVSDDLRVFAGLVLVVLALVYLYSRGTVSRVAIGPALFFFVGVDLLYANSGNFAVVPSAAVYPATPVISWLMQHAGTDRIMPVNDHWSNVNPPDAVLPPNGATVFGLFETQGYDSLQTRSYKQFANDLDGKESSPQENGNITFTNNPGSKDAEFSDAKYIVSREPLVGFGTAVVTDGNILIYSDPAARSIGGESAVSNIAATRVDVTTQGVIHSVVVSIQYYPGWRVYEKSDPTPSRSRSELYLEKDPESPFIDIRGLPTGATASTTMHFRFQPASFQLGLYLSLIGVMVMVITGVSKKANAKFNFS